MTPYRRYLTRGWPELRQAFPCERQTVADLPVEELVQAAPFINPCAKGHKLISAGGWIRCALCGATIGKGTDPNKPPRPKR